MFPETVATSGDVPSQASFKLRRAEANHSLPPNEKTGERVKSVGNNMGEHLQADGQGIRGEDIPWRSPSDNAAGRPTKKPRTSRERKAQQQFGGLQINGSKQPQTEERQAFPACLEPACEIQPNEEPVWHSSEIRTTPLLQTEEVLALINLEVGEGETGANEREQVISGQDRVEPHEARPEQEQGSLLPRESPRFSDEELAWFREILDQTNQQTGEKEQTLRLFGICRRDQIR